MAKRIHVSPYYYALVQVQLGDTERALQLLEQAYLQRDDRMAFLRVEPGLDGLRAEPRFRDLARRMPR